MDLSSPLASSSPEKHLLKLSSRPGKRLATSFQRVDKSNDGAFPQGPIIRENLADVWCQQRKPKASDSQQLTLRDSVLFQRDTSPRLRAAPTLQTAHAYQELNLSKAHRPLYHYPSGFPSPPRESKFENTFQKTANCYGTVPVPKSLAGTTYGHQVEFTDAPLPVLKMSGVPYQPLPPVSPQQPPQVLRKNFKYHTSKRIPPRVELLVGALAAEQLSGTSPLLSTGPPDQILSLHK
eukprot:TRINITY_DN100381_c0_g1_i1.p1 TRINITY_DN100381_c0_g1~~TRINITY_DN100381_c0_g1_i1.p1  ORF type:complete len:236 (-),score=25.63 TRINITY_DN100381_c0_g1_i1:72-779(-)